MFPRKELHFWGVGGMVYCNVAANRPTQLRSRFLLLITPRDVRFDLTRVQGTSRAMGVLACSPYVDDTLLQNAQTAMLEGLSWCGRLMTPDLRLLHGSPEQKAAARKAQPPVVSGPVGWLGRWRVVSTVTPVEGGGASSTSSSSSSRFKAAASRCQGVVPPPQLPLLVDASDAKEQSSGRKRMAEIAAERAAAALVAAAAAAAGQGSSSDPPPSVGAVQEVEADVETESDSDEDMAMAKHVWLGSMQQQQQAGSSSSSSSSAARQQQHRRIGQPPQDRMMQRRMSERSRLCSSQGARCSSSSMIAAGAQAELQAAHPSQTAAEQLSTLRVRRNRAADTPGHAWQHRPIGVTVSIDHISALRDLGTVTDDEEAADEARRLVVGPHW